LISVFLTFNLEEKGVKSQYYFLLAAFASFVFSVSLWFMGDADLNRQQAIFVGLWVPSILALGNLVNE
jgi:hypothetical protein